VSCEYELLDPYFREVLGDRFQYVSAHPVRRAYGAAHKYWLVHAADVVDGFLLMNDAIVKGCCRRCNAHLARQVVSSPAHLGRRVRPTLRTFGCPDTLAWPNGDFRRLPALGSLPDLRHRWELRSLRR
jgi:hypothetical protein